MLLHLQWLLWAEYHLLQPLDCSEGIAIPFPNKCYHQCLPITAAITSSTFCRSWSSLEQNCWFIEDKLSSTAVDFIHEIYNSSVPEKINFYKCHNRMWNLHKVLYIDVHYLNYTPLMLLTSAASVLPSLTRISLFARDQVVLSLICQNPLSAAIAWSAISTLGKSSITILSPRNYAMLSELNYKQHDMQKFLLDTRRILFMPFPHQREKR